MANGNPGSRGEGTVPMPDVLLALQTLECDRFLSFEGEKKWHPGTPEPGIALPHFVQWFRKN
jgi:fatty-acyl-CoA synthase